MPASGNSPEPTTLLHGFSELWDGSSIHRDASVLVRGGRVAWVGPRGHAPAASSVHHMDGRIGLPGLVDPHTHSVFAGSRAADFQRRLAGESYTAILEAGGGIHSTVRATQQASEDELTALAQVRLADMRARGVTTVEVKSGYGLSPEHEARMLRAARAAAGPSNVVTTFLGAHARPAGRTDYVEEVVGAQLTACAPYADGIDVYCDRGAFTLDEARRVLEAGRAAGLQLRIHAEQVAFTGAARMAAELGALSADHLEHVDADGIAAMAGAGTIAVLLPGAMLYLKDPAPPVAALRAAGVRMAVGTDFNPGSSPVRDLLGCATLACVTMGLTVDEALAGITRNAADALGRPELGRIVPGAQADIAVFRPPPGEPAEARVLVQYLGGHVAEHVFVRGERVCGVSA